MGDARLAACCCLLLLARPPFAQGKRSRQRAALALRALQAQARWKREEAAGAFVSRHCRQASRVTSFCIESRPPCRATAGDTTTPTSN